MWLVGRILLEMFYSVSVKVQVTPCLQVRCHDNAWNVLDRFVRSARVTSFFFLFLVSMLSLLQASRVCGIVGQTNIFLVGRHCLKVSERERAFSFPIPVLFLIIILFIFACTEHGFNCSWTSSGAPWTALTWPLIYALLMHFCIIHISSLLSQDLRGCYLCIVMYIVKVWSFKPFVVVFLFSFF